MSERYYNPGICPCAKCGDDETPLTCHVRGMWICPACSDEDIGYWKEKCAGLITAVDALMYDHADGCQACWRYANKDEGEMCEAAKLATEALKKAGE